MNNTAQIAHTTPSDVKALLLEDVLAAAGHLTFDQVNFVKNEVKRRQESSERIITQMNWVTVEQLVEAKAKVMGVPYCKPDVLPLAPEVLNYVPEDVAKRFTVIPIAKDGDTLSVAMVDPLDLQTIEFVEKKSGFSVRPFLASAESIKRAVNDQYNRGLSSDVTEALKEATGGVSKTPMQQFDATTVLGEAPVAKIVSTILEYGIKIKASDIHIEPLENESRVRYRIDGILQEKLVLPKNIHDAIVSRIKILGNMKIDEKRIPQDARFNFKIAQEDFDLRLSSLPTAFGEKVVMRLLKKTGGVPTLNELGLRGKALQNLQDTIARPHGIILITGPTGSGKTTTLYSILSKLNSTAVNIITLEDPIEYQIAGVNQVQVNIPAGLTFASGLRSFLRQDPNIIMVGEIRDAETADLAVQASLTGHLVFSTLHTNNAAGALPRLLDMHAEPYLIASTVNCIVGQRVVRVICPSCKTQKPLTAEITEELKKVLGKLFDEEKKLMLFYGKGCTECNGTGYQGRTGIYEVLLVTDKIARLILVHETAQTIENQSITDGMITMKQDGYLKVIEGTTTIEEVLRVAQE
jgi:type IV pilus assembly protein PilB